jgi:hypothetical protein
VTLKQIPAWHHWPSRRLRRDVAFDVASGGGSKGYRKASRGARHIERAVLGGGWQRVCFRAIHGLDGPWLGVPPEWPGAFISAPARVAPCSGVILEDIASVGQFQSNPA